MKESVFALSSIKEGDGRINLRQRTYSIRDYALMFPHQWNRAFWYCISLVATYLLMTNSHILKLRGTKAHDSIEHSLTSYSPESGEENFHMKSSSSPRL